APDVLRLQFGRSALRGRRGVLTPRCARPPRVRRRLLRCLPLPRSSDAEAVEAPHPLEGRQSRPNFGEGQDVTTHSDVLTRLAALANSLKSLTGRQATLKGREAEALARAEIV